VFSLEFQELAPANNSSPVKGLYKSAQKLRDCGFRVLVPVSPACSRRQFDLTMQTYLLHRCIDCARHLQRTTSDSINRGYINQQYFCRQFLLVPGQSASKFAVVSAWIGHRQVQSNLIHRRGYTAATCRRATGI